MSCFILPMKLIKQMTSAIRKFWWANFQNHSKISWIAWRKINDTKQMGGLRIRDLRDFNVAMIAKQSWRLLQQPHTLMARLFKAKYYPKTNLLEAGLKWQSSHAWRSILQGNQLLAKGIKWIIGNGKTVNIWKDNWLPSSPPRAPQPYGNPDVFTASQGSSHSWNQYLERAFDKSSHCS
ncbi:uncharacterized protein LOC110226750 [Arabidopsis lyrata subsp. lyrata]|uniref:uncharacterized protein LOC110226750 n=1 Tax=Arabidopsis lyrata subsp. lyrata TaxID=81972 RepID=UPI000A29AB59|nr:uncharacterized protein LOC110226750 [Arabidopsis lyrata subsp. lyrata]|eukprot:XP_020874985.1 uncharacterized protein LOC110226750 [Arabidopsis lyrata subsp. lyrata]